MKEKKMLTGIISTGVMIIINASIWGLVIIGCSYALKGTGEFANIRNILVGGSGITMMLILLGGSTITIMPRLFGTRKNSKKTEE
jgi:hypothetical protein